jgi:hypothetical protein
VARSLRLAVSVASRNSYPFASAAEVHLAGAKAGGDLDCDGGKFGSEYGSIEAEGLQVTGTMYMRTWGRPARMSLRHARAGQLLDHKSCWPPPDQLDLEWFVYGGFTGSAPRAVKARLDWLGLQHGVPVQSYEQLAKTYREGGDEASARKVNVAREWRRFRRSNLGPSGAAANLLLGGTIGYGYRPGRALYFLIALYLISALWIYPQARSVMLPTKLPAAATTITANDRCPVNYPCYSPWAYSFDILVPVVSLGQTDAWAPEGRRGDFVRYYGYVLTVLGWALATMAVAGLTGLVRRL